ncbi:hypothetical protein [Planotetraspora kaengkrachanensis]|uniref:Uncharacterized protein n=1 Tax=Planotetraspora kaengkrachanensis TaxID=575193 RepID=A0A8J3M5Z7_9ACTN|nr:hypothetical protein [Planotetraspora kaengkrachanensis]GIG80094.1 hypothetical protein Pka01_32210 [Planotetraspora kaengkrachanensis]
MTRSEFDDIRAHIAAEDPRSGGLLDIARELLDDLEQARMRESLLRTYYLGLLTAARATVAADMAGDASPMTFLEHELGKHGQLPSGEQIERILSDARTAQALLACIGEPAAPRRSAPVRLGGRCVGVTRKLRG